jgi:hypothetical protein
MTRLALHDSIKLDTELRHRTKSWVRTIRDRADDLSAGCAYEVADQAETEMQQLIAKVPNTSKVAASVAAAIRHTAMKVVAQSVDLRMARLTVWPEKDK